MNTFKWYIVWVTYQEGNRWLRSRCTMQNVGLTKNTLIKNTHALIFISLKFKWVTLFCALISPKENAFFGPEELQITLKGRPSRVNYSSGPEVLPSHFKSIDQ